ncbi:MAG: hypothetical protein ICV60_14695 [Pyrinomonadaceae bacterium]|nr:hypothetical protein [Pyrinomonadaceae bacterium]
MTDKASNAPDVAGALATLDQSQFMPAMTIELAVERYNTITEFVSRVLRRDVDYGTIPGTDKLTLLKPGAEKLTTFFGLSTRFQVIERIEDWTGAMHEGEPFFYYLSRCQLYRGELLVAEADASCNSRETKYRYREAQRICPSCQQAAIIKGKEEYGGGWICFKKKGGCGAKFSNGDASIETQTVGRIFNPDIADQVNTIQKMSQKRALVAATLLAVNASEFFTQDIEDIMTIPTSAASVDARDNSFAKNAERSVAADEGRLRATADEGRFSPARPAAVDEDADLRPAILSACRALGKTEEQLEDWIQKKFGAGKIDGLTAGQKREVLSFLNGRIAKQQAA